MDLYKKYFQQGMNASTRERQEFRAEFGKGSPTTNGSPWLLQAEMLVTETNVSLASGSGAMTRPPARSSSAHGARGPAASAASASKPAAKPASFATKPGVKPAAKAPPKK